MDKALIRVLLAVTMVLAPTALVVVDDELSGCMEGGDGPMRKSRSVMASWSAFSARLLIIGMLLVTFMCLWLVRFWWYVCHSDDEFVSFSIICFSTAAR